jgi:hypothetical protein
VQTPTCTNGVCTCSAASCLAGWGNCNGTCKTLGCNDDLTSDNNNCGSCGTMCDPITPTNPNGTSVCTNGRCLLYNGETCSLNTQCLSNVCTVPFGMVVGTCTPF